MRIKSVHVNNRKKTLEIETSKGGYSLPFSKLEFRPKLIAHAFVDKELANRAVTYVLHSNKEGSVHVDAFLEYNNDPDHMKEAALYKLTLMAQTALKISRLSKREIARKMQTSPAQLYRLLDTANYKKTIDQMFKLLACLGYEVDVIKRKPTELRESL